MVFNPKTVHYSLKINNKGAGKVKLGKSKIIKKIQKIIMIIII
jgi:mRNA-degrading endonuclease RelE of RelBE toxin-antitoxin system